MVTFPAVKENTPPPASKAASASRAQATGKAVPQSAGATPARSRERRLSSAARHRAVNSASVPSAPMAQPAIRDGEPTPAACEALGFAPASIVAPMEFIRLPVISLVGVWLYGEQLSPTVFAGAALIVAGNLVNLRAETRRRSPA